MQITNDYLQQCRIEALHAALEIESLHPYSPITLNLDALPKDSDDFDMDKFLRLLKSGKTISIQTETEPMSTCIVTTFMLNRADKIFEWLTKGESIQNKKQTSY
jgi:hypothetical protein